MLCAHAFIFYVDRNWLLTVAFSPCRRPPFLNIVTKADNKKKSKPTPPPSLHNSKGLLVCWYGLKVMEFLKLSNTDLTDQVMKVHITNNFFFK